LNIQIEWGDWSKDGHNQSSSLSLQVSSLSSDAVSADVVEEVISKVCTFCDRSSILRYYEESCLTPEGVQSLREAGVSLPPLIWFDREYANEESQEYRKLLETSASYEEWDGHFEDQDCVEYFFVALLNHFAKGNLLFTKDATTKKFVASFGYGWFNT
jgi:hypothetical protein